MYFISPIYFLYTAVLPVVTAAGAFLKLLSVFSPPSIAVQKLDPTPPGQQPSRRRPSLSYRLWSEGGWIQDKLSTYLSEMFFSLSLSLLCHFGICLSISACLCHLKQEVSKKIRDGWHRQELGAEPNKGTDGAPGKMSGINFLSTTSTRCTPQ